MCPKHKINYVPHGVPQELFFPLKQEHIDAHRKKMFGDKRAKDHIVFLWVARNARRKCPSDVLASFKMFLDDLEKKHGHRNSSLVMHTDPRDQEGPNLHAVVDMLKLNNDVIFSTNRTDFKDMNALYNACDVLINNSCFTGETLIATKEGYKQIKDIDVSEEVATHKNRYRKVLQKSERYVRHDEKLYTLTTSNYSPVQVTGEHPIRAIKKSKVNFLINENLEKFKSLVEWVNVEDLKIGDYVVYDNLVPTTPTQQVFDLYQYVDKIQKNGRNDIMYQQYHCDDNWIYDGKLETGRKCCKRFITLDEDLAYALGLWVADGITNSAVFCLNGKTEQDLAVTVKEKLERIFQFEARIIERQENRIGVCLRNETIPGQFFTDLCGQYSHGKYVPDVILNASDELKRKFIEGYVDGDGCVLRHPSYSTTKTRIRTVSHKLAQTLRTLLISIGECPKMSYAPNTGFTKNPIWTIEWSHRRVKSSTKNANGSCRTWNIDHDMVVSRVRNITHEYVQPETIKVYNFEVEEDHSYSTVNFTAHNCAEGFGLPLLEMKQCGHPIIAITTGGMTPQIIDQRTGEEYGVAMSADVKSIVGNQSIPYITEHFVSHEKLSNAMMKMYDLGPEGRKELGMKAREHALREFNINDMIRKWDDSLTKLIEDWRAGRRESRWQKVEL